MVSLTDDEIDRINRANLALLLHKFPHEIDDMPLQDCDDVLEIARANDEIQALKTRRKTRI